jgi:N-methylhydantoinase A
MPLQAVEFLTFRLRATTPKAPFELRRIDGGGGDATRAIKRTRTCRFAGRDVKTPVYDGAMLRAGDRFEGPAIIEETTTTVVIPTRYRCEVDEYRNYVLSRQPQAAERRGGLVEAAAGGLT